MSTATLESRKLYLKYNLTTAGVSKLKNQTLNDLKSTITDDEYLQYSTSVAKLLVDNTPIVYKNILYSIV